MAFNLEEAARLYTRELLARAWAMLGDWHEAEDAVQDAFAAACEKPPKPGGERAWLHRVTYNRCLDRLRRRRDVSLEALGDAAGGFTPEYDEGCAPAVIAALSRLKGEDRAIVLWRVYDELDYAEIARRLGIGEAAARKRYERAKKQLASELREYESEVNNGL